MEQRQSSPDASAVRISFDCSGALTPDQAHVLAGRLIGDAPRAPDEVELNPAGAGWLLYRETDSLTLDELTATVMWLRDLAGIAEVRWEFAVDV